MFQSLIKETLSLSDVTDKDELLFMVRTKKTKEREETRRKKRNEKRENKKRGTKKNKERPKT